MRQFSYKYRSYMFNRHGFVNMVPDAKMLHPYLGFSGYHGQCTFQTAANPNYSKEFCSIFSSGDMKMRHSVKIFFPEVRSGVIAIDKVKYSIDKSEDDDVKVASRVIFDGKYKEYIEIKDFTAKFDIEISVSFGRRGSIQHPVEVFCDFIDIYIHNQRISLTIHDNTLLFIPYVMSYRTEFPPEAARLERSGVNFDINSDVSYGFILNEDAAKKLRSKGFDSGKLDNIMIDTLKHNNYYTDGMWDHGDMHNPDIKTLLQEIGPSTDRYICTLPQSIFPDKMTLAGIPIFDSEKIMSCCDIKKAGLCSPYYSMYRIDVPPKCVPTQCDSKRCQEQYQYDVRNKVLDSYLVLSQKPIEELDRLSRVLSDQIVSNSSEYTIGEEI